MKDWWQEVDKRLAVEAERASRGERTLLGEMLADWTCRVPSKEVLDAINRPSKAPTHD